VTPFRYTRQLFAIILGFAVFGEWPDLLTWAGIGVIILSGLYTARAGRQDR
jgi:drug/metabolite transporter (DMT)-like permease